MSETLTFGPEWLRNLSSGNSVTSPPPSPGPKYKLAEHRYGKEEMLALFSEDVKFPEELELFDSVCRSRPVLPLAFQPLTEEEQRNSVGSVNSNAVLKLMGRGGARGVGPPRGPGRGGIRGRGRGDGGYVRQTSYEDTRDGGGGFGRGIDTRRQGWNENSRGGFERSPSLRESGPSGPGRGGYDPSLARPRLSSDTSWERPERRSDSGNWRSGGLGGEDDDGWRISGQRSADRSDKWRGGSTRGRAPWRGGTDSNRERGHPDDEWQTARSRRSYHDHEDVRWSSSNERLPEWSNDDTDDFNTPGTFDSSGAFVLHKQKEERDRSESERKSEEHKETTDRNKRSQSESDTSQNEDPDVWKEEDQDDNIFSDTGTKTVSEERSTETSQPPAQKSPTTEQALNNLKKPSSTSASSSSQPHSPSSLNRQSSPTQSSAPNKPQSVSELAQAHLPSQPHVTMPSIAPQEDASVRKEEEPNMEHFAKAAENLVASLDDDEEDLHVKDVAKTTNQQQEFRTSPTTPDELQWSYTDPQGKVQGPFSNSEMADWFSHGYFTMGLLVKRTTDEVFQPLGEIIKQWGRVPFIPGPQPPPFKGVPEHIQRQQQQQMIAQQQYQHLMQQHYLQQQLFHQQALMMQQQQLQHNQQQMQQVQQPPQHSPPHNTSPPSTQHSQPQPTQGGAPSQQPVRPQAISPHAESIWGSTSPSQGTPSMITPGPWSPVKPTASSKGWDREKNQQHVPSFEEIQRIEEEKEKQTRLEIERREAKARALRLKQEEEERRRLQEAAMLKKQQEEEERRRQEEAERRRKEQEELQKKQQEEARRKQEEEMRRKQEQQEAMRKHEQQRQQLELQKKKEEQKRMNELRQQQQQALLRLQQQQELMRKKEMQQKAEMQQRELQQKLQQKRQESQVTGSLWGAPTPVSGTLSLAQIQQQEERERKQRELQLQQQLQAQQREQQSRGMPGWGDRPPPTNQPVKSLLQIQQEQARQLDKRQQGPVLSRSQPSHNPLSSSVWGNTGGSLSASWGPAANSGNIWGAAPPKPPQPQSYDEDDEEDDDDDSDDDDDDEEDDEGNGGSFWDDAVKAASKSQQQQRQQQPPVQQRQQQPSQQPSNKVTEKRTNRDEENLRRLFQQQSSADEFSQWCYQSLRSLNNASSIDIPTFSAFLREVDSPYEVYDYVKQYLGDNRDTREFAREFIERRKKQKEKTPVSVASFHQAGVWGAPVSRGPPTGRPTGGNQSSAFLSGPVPDDPQDAMNKKKRKKKMQKVDPSILGFSVNAADRVNMGEIQTVED